MCVVMLFDSTLHFISISTLRFTLISIFRSPCDMATEENKNMEDYMVSLKSDTLSDNMRKHNT